MRLLRLLSRLVRLVCPNDGAALERDCLKLGLRRRKHGGSEARILLELGDEGGPAAILDVLVHPVEEVDLHVRQRLGPRLGLERHWF